MATGRRVQAGRDGGLELAFGRARMVGCAPMWIVRPPGAKFDWSRLGFGLSAHVWAWICLVAGVLTFFPWGLGYVLILAALVLSLRVLAGGRLLHGFVLLAASGACAALFGFILLFIIGDMRQKVQLRRVPANLPPPVDMRGKTVPGVPPAADRARLEEAVRRQGEAVERAKESARGRAQ